MKKLLRIGLVLAILLAVVLVGVVLIKRKQSALKQTPAYADRARPVTVAVVEKDDLALEKEYLAVVEPFETARVTARVTAPIKTINVDEDDRVEAGDVLAVLDDEEVRHRIAAAEARIEQARAELAGSQATVTALEVSNRFWQAELKRQKALAAKGTIPETEADRTADTAADVQGRLISARQKIKAIDSQITALTQQKDELQTRLGYYTLSSPVAGVVSRRLVDPGDLAAPNAPLFEIQDKTRLKIAFDVPQKDLPDINRESTAQFNVKGKSHEAAINVLHPSLDKAKMMRAEIWIAQQERSPALVAGAYLPVSVTVRQFNNVALLPAAAVISGPDGQDHVFAVTDDDRLAARRVEVLGRSGDRVAARGVDPGTRVVRNTFLGWATLAAGDKVEAVQ